MNNIKNWIKNILTKKTSSMGPGAGPVLEDTKRMAKARIFCG